jgi:integrase
VTSESVAIWDLQDRRSYGRTKKPWIVRWRVGHHSKSAAFATKAEAQAFESRLRVAKSDGERFDSVSCMPVTWVDKQTPQVQAWARTWLGQQWPEWQPRTRTSAVDALAKWLPLMSSGQQVPDGIYSYLITALRPESVIDPTHKSEAWLTKNMLRLDELTPELLENVITEAAISSTGKRYAQTTLQRHRTTAKAMITRALDLQIIDRDPWPKVQSGRSRRKTVRRLAGASVNAKLLPDPTRMRQVIRAMQSHQPASEMYAVIAHTMWLGGLRPSEVIDLDLSSCKLPASGWGELRVDQADIGEEEPGDPKTGPRTVPIPPELVEVLSAWIQKSGTKGFLFRTRSEKRPTNFGRTLHKACDEVGFPRMRPYDLRHTAATTYLNAGTAPGEVAKRMGHSVETLLSTYAGVLEGDDARANTLFESAIK